MTRFVFSCRCGCKPLDKGKVKDPIDRSLSDIASYLLVLHSITNTCRLGQLVILTPWFERAVARMIDASTRLKRAILLSDALLVKRIIHSNPGILQNPDFKDKSNTSLHLAAQTGSEEIVVRRYTRRIQRPRNRHT